MGVVKESAIKTAIESNIDVMLVLATEAIGALEVAKEEIAAGNQNGAMGALLPLQRSLPDMNGLLVAMIALHRA